MKYVFRTLARRPGFTAAVLLTLGLGIAANTAIFSVVNGVLLQPLPFESPEQLVTPDVMSSQGFYISTSIPNYYDWKDQSHSFEAFGAYRGSSAVLTVLDRPEVVQPRQILGDFFGVLGIGAARGRTIGADEAEPGAAPIAVVSHGFWQDQLGGDPQALGRTLSIDDNPFEVVGVMPEGFAFPSPQNDIYLPMGYFSEDLSWNARGSSSGTSAVARLLPDVSIEQAQTDLDCITASIHKTADPLAASPILVSVTERYVGDVRAARHLRGLGTRAGGHRHPRSDVLFGSPTYARGGHPYGPRRRNAAGPVAHVTARPEAGTGGLGRSGRWRLRVRSRPSCTASGPRNR